MWQEARGRGGDWLGRWAIRIPLDARKLLTYFVDSSTPGKFGNLNPTAVMDPTLIVMNRQMLGP